MSLCALVAGQEADLFCMEPRDVGRDIERYRRKHETDVHGAAPDARSLADPPRAKSGDL